jgi:predicted hotdog family 3-hydroxylacyl-ACP dehydratase
MLLDRTQIAELIPHAGAMCLLDGVLRWDETSISCVSRRHRDPGNPLRRGDALGAACGIEFAAQAMAVHSRLTAPAGDRPKAGFLVSLREVTCRARRLDQLAEELVLAAERLAGDERQALYRFAVTCGARNLMDGRATVLLGLLPP